MIEKYYIIFLELLKLKEKRQEIFYLNNQPKNSNALIRQIELSFS